MNNIQVLHYDHKTDMYTVRINGAVKEIDSQQYYDLPILAKA